MTGRSRFQQLYDGGSIRLNKRIGASGVEPQLELGIDRLLHSIRISFADHTAARHAHGTDK